MRKLTVILAFLLLLSGCNDTETTTPENKYLVSGTLVGEYTRDEFVKALGQFGTDFGLFIRSGIKQYKIIYKTKNTDGTEITASGAFIVPTLSESLPLASIQHGTIQNDNEAPSYFNVNSEVSIGGFLASTGYLVAMPDYIGYNESKQIPHTYEHREGLATASLDMIRAAREFIKTNNLNWNNNLYLTGYSEGGFATMALLKKMEEEVRTEFNIKAATCGAGAYNKTESFRRLVSEPSSGIASNNRLYLWVLLTYDRLYNLNRPASAYFKEPYAAAVQANRQNANINVSLHLAVSDAFKTGILNKTDTPLINAIKDNDVFDWKPATPLRLYHGDADDLVPYFNSQTTVEAMKARGANVPLVTVAKGDHATTVESYLLGTFEFFSSNR
jgi:pimeloyl-ACP methyl ester carboxylesterase